MKSAAIVEPNSENISAKSLIIINIIIIIIY